LAATCSTTEPLGFPAANTVGAAGEIIDGIRCGRRDYNASSDTQTIR